MRAAGGPAPLGRDEAGLPPCYDAVPLWAHDAPISADVEIARWMADDERRGGRRRTVVFRSIREHPGSAVLCNPYPRLVMLAAMGTSPETWQAETARRLAGPAPGAVGAGAEWSELAEGLDALPALRHRPGDAGRYVTAGVGVTRDPESGRVNLGVYRIQVAGPFRARVFFDPRTDAHRNWERSLAAGRPLPLAVFLGADPVHLLVAASRLPAEGDDYLTSSRLLGRAVSLSGEPPVPADAHYVVFGEVTGRLETEGPFAEFKGYYVDARQSPVFEVHQVVRAPRAVYPTIVTGAESGLTLMALQNEYLMYAHLAAEGFPVRGVRYLLDARAEFVTLIECDEPSQALVRSAMTFDVRTKVVLCGPQLDQPWQALATFGFRVHAEPWRRKGRVEGERIGIVLDLPPEGRAVEF